MSQLRPACLLAFVVAVASSACGGAQPASTTSEQRGVSSLTPSECEAAGGEVVGDIGDGAIHRPDYRCPMSGEPPIGSILPEAGQPMAIEGAVCCR